MIDNNLHNLKTKILAHDTRQRKKINNLFVKVYKIHNMNYTFVIASPNIDFGDC